MIPTDRTVIEVVERHLRDELGEAWQRPHSLAVAQELRLTRSAGNGGPKETPRSMGSRPLVKHMGHSRAERMLAAVESLNPLWRRVLELLAAGHSRRQAAKLIGMPEKAGREVAREALAAARMYLAVG